ncbi:uncharacterized protein LOC128671065 isoform X2 [Plodia interpunctella]|uniref:uncharacterized protein LOC128671065 isoform X2 n=1 Tax=Plodia interpunctella TaxID=58824 RepID=UPI002368756F|nr:uncharacterized protein LOC128671065 isoform X2 [Plodia interpunctella]
MGGRQERLKNSLGISEYPWSSDDDENENNHTNPLNLVRRPEDAPRPSLGEMPGTSSEPTLAQIPTGSSAPRTEPNAESGMIWTYNFENHPQSRTRFCDAGMASTSQNPRLPLILPERRESRLERPSSADMQRVIARWKTRDEFIRFTKSLSAMRNNRPNPNIYPVYSRSTSGPSRNPLFNHAVSADTPPVTRTHFRHLPKRLYTNRSDYGSPSRRSGCSSSGHGSRGNGCLPTHNSSLLNPASEEMHQETFNVELSDEELVSTTPPPREINSAAADRSGDITEDVHDTSGGTTSDEPAPAPDANAAPQDSVDGPDRITEEGTELADAAPSTSQSQHNREKKRRDDHDDSEPSSVKEFNQNLLRLLECPVCLEWMEPPIAQCRRGHLVCTACRGRLAACPVCRTTFSSVRNRAMEGVSELLRYPCRHGCGREVRLRRRTQHEASCAARKYQCPVAACAQRSPLAMHELAHHFQSKHVDVLKTGRKHKFSMKVNSEHHDDWIIMALHEFFHLRVDVDVRNWGVVFYVAYIGPKSNAKNFTYSITINGQNQSRKLSYVRVTHSDLDRSLLNVNRTDCFHLTLDQALNFLRFKSRHSDPDKYLDFNVEIAKTDDDEENKETQET